LIQQLAGKDSQTQVAQVVQVAAVALAQLQLE
jgi:hypothetical protein